MCCSRSTHVQETTCQELLRSIMCGILTFVTAVLVMPATSVQQGHLRAAALPADKIAIAAQRVLEAKLQAQQLEGLRQDIAASMSQIQAGGRRARNSLAHLVAISTEPNAKTVMKTLGVEVAAARIMKSPASSEELQGLAGSLITLFSDMPGPRIVFDERIHLLPTQCCHACCALLSDIR